MQPSRKCIKQSHRNCIFVVANCHQKCFLYIEYKEVLEEKLSNIILKDLIQHGKANFLTFFFFTYVHFYKRGLI